MAWRGWERFGANEELTWPEPLTVPERLVRAGTFWSRVLPIVARYTALQRFAPDDEAAWQAAHDYGSSVLAVTFAELRGYYQKSAQLIGSRPDLFPPLYCDRLSPFQDDSPPMPGALVARLVELELGVRLDVLFSEFDAVPLGSASVAQVHRARLRSNGKEVAVKVQRPGMEPLMLGDVANLKKLAELTRGQLVVDYYTVFSELELQLRFEFDMVKEAENMSRVADMLEEGPGPPPLRVPRPVPGLIKKRVLVMDFIPGQTLARLASGAAGRETGAAAVLARQVLGRKLLRALTDAYAIMLLRHGFIHGDPHPGNLMLTPDGGVALIDYGQCKQLEPLLQRQLAGIFLQLTKWKAAAHVPGSAEESAALAPLAQSALALGVCFKPTCPDVNITAAALALWLFDSTAAAVLPGGYVSNELSPLSPVAEVASFPQALVFVGRATVLIRGLANRLGVDWSLAQEWAPAARRLLEPQAAAAEVAAPQGVVTRLRAAWRAVAEWWMALLLRLVAWAAARRAGGGGAAAAAA